MLILAVAACFGAAASLLGFGATIQVVVAAVAASLGCGYLWRRHKAGRLAEKPGDNSFDIGQPVEVKAWAEDRTARVQYRGAEWLAEAVPGAELVPGRWVIERTEGPRLVIAPSRKNG